MAYIGNSPGVASQRVETAFTATASQTVFTPSSGYTLGYCDVYYNGVKLVNGDDYTAADGVSITLATAAAAGDSVVVVASFPRGLSDGYLKAEADAKYVALTGDQTIAGVKTFSGSATIVNGNLGVGTSSVLGNSTFNAALGIAVRNQSTSMGYFQTYNANAGSNLKTWRWGGNSSGNLVFETVNDAYSAATGRAAFDPIGNFGVGTVTPDNSTGFVFVTTNASTGSGFHAQSNGTTVTKIEGSSTGTSITAEGSRAIFLYTNSTERARFEFGGEFLVGTQSNLGVGAKVAFVSGGNVLHIKSTSSGANNMVSYDSAGNPTFALSNGGAISCASLNVNGSATVNDGILIRDSSGGGSLMKVRVERFGITATSGGATVNLGSGTRFTGFVIIGGESNDTASGVWHVVSDSEYDYDAITALATKGGASYTGPATLAVSSVLAGSLRLTVTGSGYRVYNVMMIGNFG